MSATLISRLSTELDWPELANDSDLAEFTSRPGVHCLFVPGDPARNLETGDAAVILPELRGAFDDAFDCAVVLDSIEENVRSTHNVLKTPSFIFFEGGRMIGAIAKVRDWDDYLTRTRHILSRTGPAEAD